MSSVQRPSISAHRLSPRARFVRGTLAGAALLTGTAGCAQVDLDQLAANAGPASPSAAPHVSTTPSRMVMPTPLPTSQATAAAALTVGFPDLPGYTTSTAAPRGASAPAPTSPPRASWSRSYASPFSGCQVSAELTSAEALVVSGGDDQRPVRALVRLLGGDLPGGSAIRSAGAHGDEPLRALHRNRHDLQRQSQRLPGHGEGLRAGVVGRRSGPVGDSGVPAGSLR